MHTYIHTHACLCIHTINQVYHQQDENGRVTKFDGKSHGLINMGNGLLFTEELLRLFLVEASNNHMTFKGFWTSMVQEWENNMDGCTGELMLILAGIYLLAQVALITYLHRLP